MGEPSGLVWTPMMQRWTSGIGGQRKSGGCPIRLERLVPIISPPTAHRDKLFALRLRFSARG